MPLVLRSARAADAGGIAALHVESWRESFAGQIAAEFLEHEIEDAFAEHWQDALRGRKRKGQAVMAMTGNQIEGFAAGTFSGATGRIDSLHVRAGMQRRGIGRSLLGLLAQRMRQEGVGSAELFVFAENADAARLFQRLGGQFGAAESRPSFGQTVPQRRVTWPQITALIAACGA